MRVKDHYMILGAEDVPNISSLRSALVRSKAHSVFLDVKNQKIPISPSFCRFLESVLSELSTCTSFALIPFNQVLSTQRAAELLGVSRQYFVRLLEQKKMPFHRSGTHRRVFLGDVLAYKQERGTQRNVALDTLAKDVEEAGVVERVYVAPEVSSN